MLLTLINWRWDYLTTWSTVCHSHFGKVIFNEWNNLDSFKSAKQQCWCMKMNINSGKSSDIEKIMQKTTIKIEITILTKAYNFSYHHIWYYSLDCTTNSMRKSESVYAVTKSRVYRNLSIRKIQIGLTVCNGKSNSKENHSRAIIHIFSRMCIKLW